MNQKINNYITFFAKLLAMAPDDVEYDELMTKTNSLWNNLSDEERIEALKGSEVYKMQFYKSGVNK